MAASYFRLQGLTSAAAGQTTTQALESAVEIGRYDRLIVAVQRSQPAAAGSVLKLQTAAVKSSDSFYDLSPPIDLARTGKAEIEYHGLLRYLRWEAVVVAGGDSAIFFIDIVARGD